VRRCTVFVGSNLDDEVLPVVIHDELERDYVPKDVAYAEDQLIHEGTVVTSNEIINLLVSDDVNDSSCDESTCENDVDSLHPARFFFQTRVEVPSDCDNHKN